MYAYLITFDTNITSILSAHNAIVGSGSVNKWWHYVNGTYIVTSNHDLGTVTRNIKAKWPGEQTLLIMQASKITGGWLPRDAWQWINTNLVT